MEKMKSIGGISTDAYSSFSIYLNGRAMNSILYNSGSNDIIVKCNMFVGNKEVSYMPETDFTAGTTAEVVSVTQGLYEKAVISLKSKVAGSSSRFSLSIIADERR